MSSEWSVMHEQEDMNHSANQIGPYGFGNQRLIIANIWP